MQLRTEYLPNGLIRIYDYGCCWAVLYTREGIYHSGGVDRPEYRDAARRKAASL